MEGWWYIEEKVVRRWEAERVEREGVRGLQRFLPSLFPNGGMAGADLW